MFAYSYSSQSQNLDSDFAGTIHVEYKYFSKGEAITLKCKCVVFYWNAPAQNITNRHQVSQVEMLDMKGNPRIWSISIYTKGDDIADTLSQQLSKRLSLIGANFDLHITNLSSSDEGLYICDTSVKCIFPQYRFILYMKCKYFVTLRYGHASYNFTSLTLHNND